MCCSWLLQMGATRFATIGIVNREVTILQIGATSVLTIGIVNPEVTNAMCVAFHHYNSVLLVF